MREIPPLQVLCLRVVGSHACSAETTFAKDGKEEPSLASRLLRSFHRRPAVLVESPNNKQQQQQQLVATEELPPLRRTPCIGPGSARRAQANEVDLHHPFAGCKAGSSHHPPQPTTTNTAFWMQYGNPAMDCLQCYIDALVELGRMDDSRLGRHFFEEWRANVLLAHSSQMPTDTPTAPTTQTPASKKRRRTLPTSSLASKASPSELGSDGGIPIVGSLSLHNCTISNETFSAMQSSQMGVYLAVLDLSGVGGLTDTMLEGFLPQCTQLERLSIKNCRRVTNKGANAIAKHEASTLVSLDLGGVYNIDISKVLELVEQMSKLQELHASGLGWTDSTMEQLTELCPDWKALSLSYSLQLSQTALRQALLPVGPSLLSLSLAFCEAVVDNALLGMLGRNLPRLLYLDIRGNSSLTTLTGWYDGRVSADLLQSQPLTVLGRYSGLSQASVEETRRVHPRESSELTVVLDGTGTGLGIMSELASN